MSTTTTGGIFTFDHGQKKMHNAIGVTEEYMEDLHEQVTKVLKNFLFTEDLLPREDASPSELVEACANEFSYSQLVIMSSYFLKSEVEHFGEKIAKLNDKLSGSMKALALNADDVPEEFREMLDKLSKESGEDAISSDDIPEELRDFLINMIKRQQDDDN